jgi:hypothetical protein
MPYEITVKFNTRLLLTETLPGFDRFALIPAYLSEAARYHLIAERPPVLLHPSGPVLVPPGQLENTLAVGWSKFVDWLMAHNLKPRYLFAFNLASLPNQLWSGLSDAANKPLPNFYNYFTIPLPDTLSPTQLFDLLDELEPLLPHKSQSPAMAVLEQAYLKGDPEPLASADRPGSVTDGNQNYFTAMHIVTPPTGKGAGVKLTIVEAEGWYLSHSQFLTSPPQPKLLFPTLLHPLRVSVTDGSTAPADLLTNPTYTPGLAEHGTKILGVLKARPGDADTPTPPGKDLCQGIVPQATVRLSSCLVDLVLKPQSTPTSPQYIKSKLFNEPDAVLAALVGSAPGDVILIEVGSGGQKFPLEIQPAVYELMQVADRQQVTVVEAAGNERAYIGSRTMPTDTRSVRNTATNVLETYHSERSRTYWADYTDTYTALKAAYPTISSQYATVDDFVAHYMASNTNAILVGATDGAIGRHPDSSWGERVQVFAQGANILTTTLGSVTPNSFDITQETSGAAAIIAGVVVSLQSVARAATRPRHAPIPPSRVMTLLVGPGSSVVTDSAGGKMPNYASALTSLPYPAP